MNRQPIKSSTIISAGYENGVMEVEFSSTAVYRYLDVPPEIWKAFLATDSSKGHYFASYIRDSFRFECVYRPPRKEKTNATKDQEALPPAGSSQARTQTKKARIS